jgi:hypothetical protein
LSVLLFLLRLRSYFSLLDYQHLLVLLVIALTVRHLKPRFMLFTGVLAFAMQLGLVQLLGIVLGMLSLPKALVFCLNLVVAFFVARWLALEEESPADRVTDVNVLWFFGAAGLACLCMAADEAFAYRWWMEAGLWLAFLASFLVLANHLRPDDPTHVRSALGADLVLLFMIFVALYLTAAGVFHAGEAVEKILARIASYYPEPWVIMLICAGLAVAIMIGFGLGDRLRRDAPGRGALRWGTLLAIIGVLAGGSVLGASEPDGKIVEFLGAIMLFAVLAAPFLLIAQFLLGVGLLRMMFHLDPPRRA